MSTILSLPEELIVEIMIKGDHKMLMACQRVCRTLNVIISNSLSLQYIISLAACGMRDSLPTIACEGIVERLQKLHQHEAAWREIAWSGAGVVTHHAAFEVPVAISGGVLAFLVGHSDHRETDNLLLLFRVPSKLRGVPGESWELPMSGIGKLLEIAIDSAQDLLLCMRASSPSYDLHVRALSSGKVHPSVLHAGTFNMGIGSPDVLAGESVICCNHVAVVVRHPTLTGATVVVWNWKLGTQVVTIRPVFTHLGVDVTFLDETHLMIPASVSDSPLYPGQDYKLTLTVYDFGHSATAFGPKVVMTPYCFHVPLPAKLDIPFRQVRININTASFSSPVAPCPQGYFHADPEDRILTLEVTDGNLMRAKESAELNAPVRTFLAYMAAHPPTAVATSKRDRIDVPWEAWGPHGAHLVRSTDRPYIFHRPRTCGMRVLGAPLGKKSVVIADYHPGRVARSVGLDAAARVRARASPEIRQGAQLRHASLACVTKEVPLPKELQEISKNLMMFLCEDALLVFEYVVDGFKFHRVFSYTF